jgi:2-dehydro-3-deoxyphosphooctonate aldolase (KDO 8-P synthase)
MFTLPVVQIGSVSMDGTEPVFMLGPCVIESEEFIWSVAEQLQAMAQQHGWRWIFKASYDKANRARFHPTVVWAVKRAAHCWHGSGPSWVCL